MVSRCRYARTDGTIYFPDRGQGVYMVEEVRGMLRWAMRAYADARGNELPMIALLDAMEFTPINKALPFKGRVEKSFGDRAAIVGRTNA